MGVVIDLVLIVMIVKHDSERSEIFNFSSSEVKQRSERSQRFHFNSSKVIQRSERSQKFHVNSSEVNSVVRDFILIVV